MSLPTEEEMSKEVSEFEELVANAVRDAKPLPPEAPRVNAYICKKCKHKTLTVDVAEGTTTMILPCMAHTESRIVSLSGEKFRCDGQMISSFYAVDAPNIKLDDVPFEWRFATLPEYQDYRKKRMALADHVASGGLVLHKRTNKAAPVFTHGNFFVRPNGERLTENEAASLQTGLQVLKGVMKMDREKAKRKAHQRLMERQKSRSKRKARGSK